jgi:hypothetical protein
MHRIRPITRAVIALTLPALPSLRAFPQCKAKLKQHNISSLRNHQCPFIFRHPTQFRDRGPRLSSEQTQTHHGSIPPVECFFPIHPPHERIPTNGPRQDTGKSHLPARPSVADPLHKKRKTICSHMADRHFSLLSAGPRLESLEPLTQPLPLIFRLPFPRPHEPGRHRHRPARQQDEKHASSPFHAPIISRHTADATHSPFRRFSNPKSRIPICHSGPSGISIVNSPAYIY